MTFVGMRASRVPRRLPVPVCRPLRLASRFLRTRARECIFTGLRLMRPSLINLRMLKRELAIEISLASLGSSQMRLTPHFFTEAARRFCNFNDMMLGELSNQHGVDPQPGR